MLDPQLTASLAPPLVGTFAGYGAVRLALFLLFKPQKPRRLFGLTLPLTPGAFAAGRHHLAVGIGEAVGNHLLHHKEIAEAIAEPHFAQHLRHAIDTRITDLLSHDLGPAASLVPTRFRAFYEMGGKVLRLRFQQLLHTHLDSSEFAATLRQELHRHGMTAGPETENVIALVRSPQFKRLLDALLTNLLTEKMLAQPIGPLANLLPDKVQEGLGDLLLGEVTRVLRDEVPALAARMNLKAIAARRIEELDPRQYENLLRKTMARRANLIALLGALFGLVLGVAIAFATSKLPVA